MRNETADVLPEGWIECTIDEVTLAVSKIDPRDDPDRVIDYIDISGIDNARSVVGSVKQYRLEEAPSRARQIIRAGDVLFSTVRPYLRNIARVPSGYDQEIASTGFSVLRPARGICPGFLFYKAISRELVNTVSGLQYGVSYPAVKDEQVRGQPLWLPPLAEQRRIVAKIEELFSELDKGTESLTTARRQLEVYRQSVLKHAFEGKLTAQWREENKDKLETSERLLERIRAERITRYQRRLEEWAAVAKTWEADGKRAQRPAKPKPAKEPSPIGRELQERLPHVPAGWAWVRLGHLFSIPPQNGVYKPASEYGSGTRIIRIDDFYDGRLTRRNGFKKLRLSDEEIQKYKVRNQELIINRVNSIEYLGKCAVVGNLTENTVFESNIMKCRLIEDAVSTAYVAAYLASHEGRSRIRNNAKHAVNQASINQTDVGDVLVPMTSIEEQLRVVQEIEQKLSGADALTREIDSRLKKTEVLRQSVLKKALAGQLVPQVPCDETASVLLERIKIEKGETGKDHQTKKRDGKRTNA